MTPPDGERELTLIVGRRSVVADDVVALELRAADGAPLPPWSAGAHIDVEVAPGLVRQYSLCGDLGEPDRWRIAVLREPASRGGSRGVHENLVEGHAVRARGPRNNFPLRPADRYVFLAGGIGITPMLPMVAEAALAGADWQLHYGGRTRSSMAFADELAEAHGSRVTLYPEDEVGRIDLAGLLARPDPRTLIYCCGPDGLLRAVEEHCRAWPDDALRVERFVPREAGVEAPPPGAFEVVLGRSGTTLTVPADRSLLDVLEAAGVDVDSSCREGTCGTCETTVLSGEVDHRDSLLTEAEQKANDTMFVCVSRARTARLVLDL